MTDQNSNPKFKPDDTAWIDDGDKWIKGKVTSTKDTTATVKYTEDGEETTTTLDNEELLTNLEYIAARAKNILPAFKTGGKKTKRHRNKSRRKTTRKKTIKRKSNKKRSKK